MIRHALLLAVLFVFSGGCRKGEERPASDYACSFPIADSSGSRPQASVCQGLLATMAGDGVPGVLMSVHDPVRGEWNGSAGMADLFNGVVLAPCNRTRVGSTVKMFTAATVMLLQEEGKLDLDDRIAEYLSGDPIDRLANADQATIRQLLQHSSGIFNYIRSARFQTASLNDLVRVWHPEDLLHYAYGKPAAFAVGSDVAYSNTNYVLLGMLIEKVEGKPFYRVFEEKLFGPLGLSLTAFAAEDPVPADLIRGYVDLYSNLNVIECTYFSGWDYFTADGGLISNPHDLGVFLRALVNGQVVNAASWAEMTAWRSPSEQDTEFYPIAYGLGIFRMQTPHGVAWFHSGDAIGYYACMAYFPDQATTVVWAVNGNYGRIDQAVSTRTAMDRIFNAVLP
ncbi:MAG: beta-lactamase family protein [Flavobacteriales bacterium]|nr:beta-lactamase family protein [Flavobacteriales bacterium]